MEKTLLFASAPESSNQPNLEGDLEQTILQSALSDFISQFGLAGGCLFQFDYQRQQSLPLALVAKLPEHEPLRSLEVTLHWQQFHQAELFEIMPIEDQDNSLLYWSYGCLCTKTPDFLCYLLCWNITPLSEHQRYGLTLYAQSTKQQLGSNPQSSSSLTLHALLQRTCHQLRTPIDLILLYADLLRTVAVEPRSLDWLSNLCATAEAMHVSLDHMTTATAPTDSQYESCDLRQLLEQCWQELQPWAAAKQLRLVCSCQPLWLHVNAWRIKQVFYNLLNNAIAFSPPASQITWEWQSFQAEVLIKVSDNGAGLSPEDLHCWGTPYYSRRPGGTGLGLSIAKQIVLEHRGVLWAENLPCGGAQFCIVLPQNSSNF